MSDYKGVDEIKSSWERVSTKWYAQAKSQYLQKILLPLLTEAEALYQRNDELEAYAESCIDSLRI